MSRPVHTARPAVPADESGGAILRLALRQGPEGLPASREAALADLDASAARAAAGGAALLVGSELSMTGYVLGDRLPDLAEPADGPTDRAVARIAARHGVAIAHGRPELSGRGIHNTVRLTGPDGATLAEYRKTHLYGEWERKAFVPGDRPVVGAVLAGVRVGLLICYDVEFPEVVRAHALAGTELLLVPTALMAPHDFVARQLVPVRAAENGMYVAYANRCGAEGDLRFTGLSCLAAPDGSVPARAGEGGELLFAEVDPRAVDAARRITPYLADRRPGLYPLDGSPHPGPVPAPID
ncbi:carbon-nitrogen hydrolase family protein [Streptomyces sp. ST2-7A]|uniref:carbon-nitrogen hydrolase family protein n=1 Tax=Streptomyces sp. ST2-7A TaxID=2907214 RepID=UPI001F1A4365|nr:carbon-nitrogen hydrolase family protein [Streptomyces sp. ST2-7A]MCE7079676.1 carbon-nitrogen hydrolase family protein [Streptomyces sp. ST2-7A]